MMITIQELNYKEWVFGRIFFITDPARFNPTPVNAGLILCMRPGNERRRYIVTPSVIGCAHMQIDPGKWIWV